MRASSPVVMCEVYRQRLTCATKPQLDMLKRVTAWDGALPRNLLFYFMERPLLTRDEIFATF